MKNYTLFIPKGTQFCNAIGSSADKRKSNWIQYWREYSGYKIHQNIKCSTANCGKPAEVGGHVYFHSNEIELSRYLCIIPICQPCNKTTDCDYNKKGNLWFVLHRDINALLLPYLGKRPTSVDEWRELYVNLRHS